MSGAPWERDRTETGQCKECRFGGWFVAPTHLETREWTAQCRRFPPEDGRHAVWPTVKMFDGCGEWSARP